MSSSHNFSVHWSDEDGEYVGTVEEHPFMSWLSPLPDAALHGIEQLVHESECCP